MTDQRRRDNDNRLIRALWALGGYFSEMGGAGRPNNMSEFEIPLYIVVKVIERYDPLFYSAEYLDKRVIEAAKPVQAQVDEHLMQLSLSADEALALVSTFYARENEKMRNTYPIPRWKKLGTYLEQ